MMNTPPVNNSAMKNNKNSNNNKGSFGSKETAKDIYQARFGHNMKSAISINTDNLQSWKTADSD